MNIDYPAIVNAKTTDELVTMYSTWHKYMPEMIAEVSRELDRRKVDRTFLDAEKEKEIMANEAFLSIGKKGSPLYLIFCFLLAILGGFLGMIAGYIYAYSKTTSLAGNSFYVYDAETRKYGKAMFTVAVIVFIIVILPKVFDLFSYF